MKMMVTMFFGGVLDDDSMKMLLLMMVMVSRMKINLDGHESDIYTRSRRYWKQDSRKPHKTRL